jgi:hypothetical protein
MNMRYSLLVLLLGSLTLVACSGDDDEVDCGLVGAPNPFIQCAGDGSYVCNDVCGCARCEEGETFTFEGEVFVCTSNECFAENTGAANMQTTNAETTGDM